MNTKALPFSIPLMDAFRHDYERFRFDTHQYSHQGLFTDGEKLYAVILDVENNDALLDELREHYDKYHTVGIPPAKIVGEITQGFRLIESRSKLEKTLTHGQPMTIDETINLFVLHIPKKYHPFHVDFLFNTNEFNLTFKSELTRSEQEEVQLICEALGYQGYDFVFNVDLTMPDFPGKVEHEPNTRNNLVLTASGLMQKQFSKPLLTRYEEDEDFWAQNRQSVFSGDEVDQKGQYLLPKFEEPKSRCFVDASVFPRQNLRVYLTLYEQVIIALPLNKDSEYFYKMFQLGKYEFRELVARGRLLFVAPQNLERYSQELLSDILMVDPCSIIFSRRLAASTIRGIQGKSGIIGTTFSSDEQYHFLHQCSRIESPSIQSLAQTLSEQWQCGEYMVNREGAVSTHRLGLSSIAAKGFELRGRDIYLELSTAAMAYEYAQGLSAHHFPFDGEQYSEVSACQVISGFYNGVRTDSKQIHESELGMLLHEIFAIDNDMDILELDSALSNSLIRSLPSIVNQFANMDESERFHKLRALKDEVTRIESNKTRMSRLNISGFPSVAAGAGMELVGIKGGGVVALGGWLLNALNVYADELQLTNSPIFTKLSSLNHFTSHDAVIIQRVRKRISTSYNASLQ
ncbi:hypothetical protein BCT46_00045 [Vibrio sp. 10N.261.46.E8]|uniref:hypothetical protein n=1 Tax=unclassified Vibrio TaxID=2614977 RepID=UPI000977500C|nr:MULTISPECIES: hypothetical protein [unclassified Vibrio]OMO36531.1 hypothetical protein BH584_03530 [Vibrio sp. 10N.261.45.E1]PMJ28287.1 hypothetical protein BCU27_06220 [Vibrio sp. 10N.286.45.B6]PMM91079.1 hypothetical protein BCT46_00045 [Vibrio sp. 10N.261.46.E8]